MLFNCLQEKIYRQTIVFKKKKIYAIILEVVSNSVETISNIIPIKIFSYSNLKIFKIPYIYFNLPTCI